MWTVDQTEMSRSFMWLEPGEDLLPMLESLAAERGWAQALVTGAGELQLAEVVDPSGQTDTIGPAEVIALSGTIRSGSSGCSVTLRATLTSEGSLLSGRIVAAVVGDLLLLVDAATAAAVTFEHVAPSSEAAPQGEASPPVAVVDEPTLAEASAAEPPAAGSEQAPLSAPKPPSRTFRTRPIPRRIPGVRKAALDDDVVPEPGDFIDHPQLGLCRVDDTDERGNTIITVPSGRRRALKLEALQVLPAVVDDEGRRVLKVTGPKRR